jgi:hypothetical protein
MHRPRRARHQSLHDLAGKLARAIAEQPLSLGIDRDNPADSIDAHHGVRGRFHKF